jgi:hypothetical protein
VNGQLHAPATSSPGKEPRYALDWWLGGAQSRFGRGGKDKIIPAFPRNKNPGRPGRVAHHSKVCHHTHRNYGLQTATKAPATSWKCCIICTLHQYSGYKIKDEMGGACSTHGRDEKCIQYFGWKTWREETTGRLMRTCETNIRMDLRETGWKGVDWVRLAQDRDQWRALLNTVMNLRVPQEAGDLLTAWVTLRFSRTLLHGVS